MVTPTPRAALITGKAFAAGVRSLVQAAVIVVLSRACSACALTANPLRLLGHGRGRGARLGVLLLPVDDASPGWRCPGTG